MGRREYQRVRTGLTLGINQQKDKALFEECADARNVWAPNGKLEQRPGYVGIVPLQVVASVADPTIIIKESPIGTFTDYAAGTIGNLHSLPSGDRFYLAVSVVGDIPANFSGILLNMNSLNTATGVSLTVEYWNGQSWVWLKFIDDPITYNVVAQFVQPADWAQTAVHGTTSYFLRITNSGAALSAGTEIDNGGSIAFNFPQWYIAYNTTLPYLSGMFILSGATKLYALVANTADSSNTLTVTTMTAIDAAKRDRVVTVGVSTIRDIPATSATVTQFSELYIGYSHRVMLVPFGITSSTNIYAQVESRDFAVGPNAPYDPNFISQLNAFPQANYVAFFNGRLWFGGIDDQPTTVRWGAPVPFHKVLPTISAEPVMSSDDGSPITGLAPLGEQLVVFKEDSIWIMADSGQTAFGTSSFTPVRRVAGIGCVSNASIQQVKGELIFLSKNGLYAFNGVTVRKVSEARRESENIDRLKDFWESVSPGRRPFATSTLLRSRGIYLLALSVTGSDTNNTVLVWDYEHDSLWLWDNIEAQVWLSDYGAYETERLYFADSGGRIYQLGPSNVDNGTAITSYAISQRSGFDDRLTQDVREVEVAGLNLGQTVTAEILPDDAQSGQVGNTSGAVIFTDQAEKNFDAAVFDTDYLTTDRSRKHHISTRQICNYWQVKLTHSTKGVPWSMSQLSIGYVSLGAR